MAPPTRERILDAALRSFASVGLEGTVITDLEQAAGLAPGSGGFYRYFRTKEEVLEAVVRREIATVKRREAEAPAAAEENDHTTAMRSELLAVLAGLDALGPLISILAREHGRIPELAAEISRELIESDIERRGDRGLDPVRGAIVLSALVGYHLSTDYFGGPPGDVGPDEFVDGLVELVHARDDRRRGEA